MRTADRLYVAAVQAVISFGFEMWVATPRLEKSLAGLHQRAVRQMAGMGLGLQLDGAWVYKPIGAVMVTVGLDEIGVYIVRRQNTVAQYIDTFPIMDLCL